MPVRSLDSSVLRWPEAATVESALDGWVAALVEDRPEILRLGVFGSYARGEASVGSDLDLVAVVTDSPLSPLERARAWPTERLPVPAEVLVYTSAEWEEIQRRGGRFAQVLATETRWVYQKEG